MTDETTISAAVVENSSFAPLGEVLLAARNAKKLTQKDVSNNLRLSVKQVNALETNDFANLPQVMITRGFIRNYARLLELDAEPLLESYRTRVPEATPSVLTVQTSTRQVMLSEPSTPWLKYMAGLALILLPLLAWFLYTEYSPKLASKAAENVSPISAENVAASPLPEIALPAAERMSEAAEPATAVAAIATEAPKAEVVAIQPNVTQTIEPIVIAPVVASQIVAPVATAKDTTVDFKTLKEAAVNKAQIQATTQVSATSLVKSVNLTVSEETWVRVTNKKGAVVFEKLLAANTADGFNGQPPFKVLIGNAKATSITFLGRPVDLSAATKNNVASITLE